MARVYGTAFGIAATLATQIGGPILHPLDAPDPVRGLADAIHLVARVSQNEG